MAVELTATMYFGTGTGAAASYATGIEARTSNQIKVYVNGVLQALGDDYTLAGVGGTGAVTVNATFPLNAAVYVERVTPITQLVDTQNNETVLEDVLDAEFDKLTMIAQEVDGKTQRALMVPQGEVAIPVASLAGADGKVLGVVNQEIVPIVNTASGLEQALADVEATLDAINVILSAEQYRVSIARATWAELNGIVGAANQSAVVIGTDTGTHTDNVTAGHPTVPNSGVYRYSASPAGWQWLAPAETAASALTATSNSNLALGTGNKVFALQQAGKAFAVGMTVEAYNDATHYMSGLVTAFNPNSGSLTLNVSAVVGSGSKGSWTLFLTGPAGQDGSDGSDGLSAYQIAVANGFVGTEAQWLANLQAQSTTDAQAAAAAAAAAQTATETARDAAIGAYDSFDDRYLGAYTADPALDNDGNALLVGARYWNSASNVMKTWSGSSWIADIGVTIDTDGALAANSDAMVPSQKAVKTYVDGKVAGLSWKQAVRAATTAAGTLATSFANGQAIDGVTLVTGDRILVKNQASASENGIYVVASSGAPTRASDADSGGELVNASVYVSEGTLQADTQWTCTTNAPITPGSTSLAFAQFGVNGGVDTYAKNSADQTTTSATLVDITGLAFTPAANTTYEIEALVPCTHGTNTNTFHLGVAWPSAGVTLGYASIDYSPADGTNNNTMTQGTSAAAFETGGVAGGNSVIRMATFKATLKMGASPSGTFKLQFGSNGVTTATIKNGAYLRYRSI